MVLAIGRSASASAEQRPCHAREPHQDAVSATFVRAGAVSGRAADTGADTVSDRTCDRSPPARIYIPVTSSFADLQIPQTLIDRACAGELRAFEQIYRRFERPMYTLALRMLGEADAARDVLHDAMLKAFQRIGQYRNEAPFWAWLRQIALNEALMRLRKVRDIDTGFDPDMISDESAAPWAQSDAATLDRALSNLPATTRSVIWLYHVEGYSHPEIAEMMGKTTSFSKSQLARGTARLRALLDPAVEVCHV
jgi:RNA polymerase sigma factor (sigma-70 family)